MDKDLNKLILSYIEEYGNDVWKIIRENHPNFWAEICKSRDKDRDYVNKCVDIG